jgi:hypothetical protein
MGVNIGPIEVLVLFTLPILVVWPAWRICSKAGFRGALSLLILVPLANLFLLFFLAFADWPALRRHKEPLARDF